MSNFTKMIEHRQKLKRDMEMAFNNKDADWFRAKLFRLIAKADLQNRELIRKGFPEEVAVYEAWLYEPRRNDEATQ